MRKRTILFLAVLVVLAELCSPAPVAADTVSAPTFYIGTTPFKFVGGFLPGWHWGSYGNEAADLDQIVSARATGITVMHLMLPQFESPRGTYDDAMLARLDRYLDTAYNNKMYVMISFIQAYSETALQPNSPYYYPRGIEGLIKDPTLHDAFKARIATLVNRPNTVNGRIYREDPTILAWIVCDEPVSAPFNYPGGVPQITLDDLTDWFTEMASYIKSMDPNHLVSVYAQPAIQGFFGITSDYQKALGIPEFDFVYMEDAGLDVITSNCDGYTCCPRSPNFNAEQFYMGKPVVFLPAFTSGCWDNAAICHDYTLQANDLDEAIQKYFEMGAAAALVQNWGSDLYSSLPAFDQCFVYTDSNTTVTGKLVARSQAVNPNVYPNPITPGQFVTAGAVTPRYILDVTRLGGGTVTSSPAGIDCGNSSSACSSNFLQGATVTLTAVADPGSSLTSWEGCASVNGDVCTVNMTGRKAVTATFNISGPVFYTLNAVKINPAGGTVNSVPYGIDCGPTCSSPFLQGTAVNITATAGAGFNFTSWDGCASVSGNVCSVTMTRNMTITATFASTAPPGPAPAISTISPTNGGIGSTATITGKYFGATQGASTVKFGGVTVASITTWSGTKIICKVPAGIAAGPVPVVVTVGTQSSPGKTFTVKAPLVSGVSPPSGANGIAVSVSGNYFGAAKGSSTVTIGGVEASVNSWTNTKINFTVPGGIGTSPVPVVVSAGGLISNATKTFTVKPPLISGVSPSSGAVGMTVNISGNYFGPSQGSSTVTFNGATVSPNTWTNTKITCTMPAGTKTGPVVVTTEAGSNAVVKTFTIKAPLLSGISPLHGQIQDTVTLSGNYFGVIQGESKVMFPANKEGDITSWSNTKITCKVPFGTMTGPVTVTTDGGASKEKRFTVDAPPP